MTVFLVHSQLDKYNDCTVHQATQGCPGAIHINITENLFKLNVIIIIPACGSCAAYYCCCCTSFSICSSNLSNTLTKFSCYQPTHPAPPLQVLAGKRYEWPAHSCHYLRQCVNV